MPVHIDPSACTLMKDQLRHSNGQFYKPNYIVKRSALDAWLDGDKTPVVAINGEKFKSIPFEEYEKMRYEEQCFIYKHNGKYQKECAQIKNTSKNALAGGTNVLWYPSSATDTFDFYEFHNHPLFRENLPNATDLDTSFWSFFDHPKSRIKNLISCIGELDYLNKPHVLCYRFKPDILQKAEEFNTLAEPIDKQTREGIKNGTMTKQDAEALGKPYMKKFEAFTEPLRQQWDEKWHRIVGKSDFKDLAYAVRKDLDDGYYEYATMQVPTIAERKAMKKQFMHEFSEWLDFSEC